MSLHSRRQVTPARCHSSRLALRADGGGVRHGQNIARGHGPHLDV